jgi:D-alanyl-D-alanine carboxypeptidase
MLGAYLRGDERKRAVAQKGGSDTGILTDGGFVTTADDRHVAVVMMANDLPPDASDEMMVPRLSELSQLFFDYLEPRGRR